MAANGGERRRNWRADPLDAVRMLQIEVIARSDVLRALDRILSRHPRVIVVLLVD